MNTTIVHTEPELHALLDSLTHGQIIAATWKHGAFSNTTVGPVKINGKSAAAFHCLRYVAGRIDPDLTSVEATVERPVTVTRDDPDALLALVESLTDGQKITAEWRSKSGERVTTATGPAELDAADVFVGVRDMWGGLFGLSRLDNLHSDLYSVTTTVTKTIRWEREA